MSKDTPPKEHIDLLFTDDNSNTWTNQLKQLINNAMDNNPYFAAGGGLMILGSSLAILRSTSIKVSQLVYKQLIVDLEITSRDKSYQWFLNWLSKQRRVHSRHLTVNTKYLQYDNGSITTKFSLVPGLGKHWIIYNNCLLSITRERSNRMIDMANSAPYETIKLTTLFRDKFVFHRILNEAKEMAIKDTKGKIVLFTSFGADWRKFGQPKLKRSMNSVVLDKGIQDSIWNDIQDFLSNSKWYIQRGIPYRRGYLLYGPPGSGKTSFIQALAGSMDYNICILNLSEMNLTDDRLNHLMNNLPQRSILLLEDIDAAFDKRLQSDGKDGYQSHVTFSGLLNALDGVTSSEETITFMTTNHPEKLDPAILRPGRIDYKVFIGNATGYQMRQMFLNFYPNELGLCEQFVDRLTRALASNQLEVSTAQLQGLFIVHKDKPQDTIRNLPAFLQSLKSLKT